MSNILLKLEFKQFKFFKYDIKKTILLLKIIKNEILNSKGTLYTGILYFMELFSRNFLDLSKLFHPYHPKRVLNSSKLWVLGWVHLSERA